MIGAWSYSAARCVCSPARWRSACSTARSASQGRARVIWIGLDAAVGGCGIWATHFIAMLAYDPGTGAGYNIRVTRAVAGFCGRDHRRRSQHRAVRCRAGRRVALGGAVVGVGVAAMHYTGMMALELPAHIVWSPGIVVASIVLGSLFAALALVVAVGPATASADALAAAVLLTVAIVSHHFTAMGAVTLVPDPTLVIDGLSISPTVLSFLTAAAAAAILGISLAAAVIDRRAKGELARQKVVLDTALENMSQGLCMFDAEGRILLFNERYGEMMGRDRLQPQGPLAARRAARSEGDRPMGRRSRSSSSPRLVAAARAGNTVTKVVDQGRPFDPRRRSADEGRRLGRDLRGHHRMAAGPGTDLAHGAPRRADQSAEPDAVPRAARAGAAARQAQ